MKRFTLCVLCAFAQLAVSASWYWPFGDDEAEQAKEPRLSELMEPASRCIDEASDLASDGKTDEAIEKYAAALAELDRIERENPERVKRPEFATLRTKRAYVSAAIDSLRLSQARDNAKAVAVSDTTALERRLREEKAGKDRAAAEAKKAAAKRVESEQAAVKRAEPRKAKASRRARRPLTKKDRVVQAIAEGDFAAADALIAEMLAERPNGLVALNLRAAKEMAEGKLREAERTLDQAIQSTPRNHISYYNMALLLLRSDNRDGARRYYETGRALGGPADADLEAMLK